MKLKSSSPIGIFLTAIGLSVSILVYSQDTAINYSQIIQVDSLTKDQIFDRIKLWSVESFKKTKGSIQVDDRLAGLLAYDARVKDLSPNAPKVQKEKDAWKLVPFMHEYTFKLKIQIKDGRYRTEIYDIKLQEGTTGEYLLTSAKRAPYSAMFSKQSKLDEHWQDAKLTFETFANNLFISLEAGVRKMDDW